MKLFYRVKRPTHKQQNTIVPFYTTLLSMIFCMVCLAGTSWAWFTANYAVGVGSITTAEWILQDVIVYQMDNVSSLTQTASDENVQSPQILVTITEDGGMKFEARANTPYLVTASATGSSSKGFILVKTCDGYFYTTDSSIEFCLLLSQTSEVMICASWGADFGEANTFPDDKKIGNGEVPVCICEILCSNEGIKEECKVCARNYSACIGRKPECSCAEKCAGVNKSCDICKNSIDNCTGTEPKSAQESVSAVEVNEESESTESVTDTESEEIDSQITSELPDDVKLPEDSELQEATESSVNTELPIGTEPVENTETTVAIESVTEITMKIS